jgi:hypothetical protein
MMVAKNNYKRMLYMILSIYALVQCTTFMGETALALFSLAAPKVDGKPILFSPYNMISYCNIVLYGGLIISGILFILAVEPFVARRVGNKRIVSMLLTVFISPIYFVLLYLISNGINGAVKLL